jgi:hypothetical protein
MMFTLIDGTRASIRSVAPEEGDASPVLPLSARHRVIRLQDGTFAAALGTGNAPPADHLDPAAHRPLVHALAALAAAADGAVALPWQGLLFPVVDQLAHPCPPSPCSRHGAPPDHSSQHKARTTVVSRIGFSRHRRFGARCRRHRVGRTARRRVDPDRRPGDILRERQVAVAGEFQPGDQGAGDGGATAQISTGIGAVEPGQERRQRRGVGQGGEPPAQTASSNGSAMMAMLILAIRPHPRGAVPPASISRHPIRRRR